MRCLQMGPAGRLLRFSLLTLGLLTLGVLTPSLHADAVDNVLRKLNDSGNVKATDAYKSYPILWDAYLDLTPPPVPIGPDGIIYHNVHPGMSNWDQISGWAESNPGMAKAIIEAETKTLFGLPYGKKNLPSRYVEAGLYAEIGKDGALHSHDIAYLRALEAITTYGTVESYRLFEAGQIQEAIDLAIAVTFVARQCCDREMMSEVFYSIPLTSWLLENLRDMMWLYQDKISPDQFAMISRQKLPFLRPDRNRLLMPEGDKIVAEELLKTVFTEQGQPDEDRFAESFAVIQASEKPLTRMGAAQRWRLIAPLHDSLEDSVDRLNLIYDDWYRRWWVQEYDRILNFDTQFERTNEVRYAAVVFAMQDMEDLFDYRKELMASVYGTSIAAGLAGYDRQRGAPPNDIEQAYATLMRKRDNRDPFEVNFEPFKYRVLDADLTVDTPDGRLRIPRGTGLLYSRGHNLDDDRGADHSRDGGSGDMILWPPMRVLARDAGLVP